MSHDQKPARMRVVASAGDVPRRRRDEVAAVPAVDDARSADLSVAAPGTTRGFVLPALFLLGCALGGAALPLVRTL